MICSPEGNILFIRLVPIKTLILTISGNLTNHMTLQSIIQTESNPEISLSLFTRNQQEFQLLKFVMGMIVEVLGEKRSGRSFFKLFIATSIVFRNCLMIRITVQRRSHQRCSIKKFVLKNFAKLTGKDLYQGLFLIKLRGTHFLHNTSG